MNPQKAVIYVRVSTSAQVDHGTSLDNQERACHEWAFRNQVQTLKVFREEGKSAKTLNRPKMRAMISYLTEHCQDISFLVVYQIDRLSRSLGDFVDLTRMLASYEVELRDTTSSVDPNESYELIQGMQALLAQHENRLKSKRVIENMRRHASAGYRMHQAPFGLHNTRDTLNRSTVEPVQPVADNIAYLLSEFAKGTFTKSQILREARKIGLFQKNGQPMGYQFLNKMLRQPLYAGFEKNTLTDGQLVTSVFGGLVPEEIYYTNQQVLENLKNK